MTALIVIGSILAVIGAYLAIGVAKARSHSVDLYRKAKTAAHKEWGLISEYAEKYTNRGYRAAMFRWVFWWPYIPIIAWFHRLFTGPIDNARADAQEARESAKTWDEVARTAKEPREREMARELAKMLRDQAKAMDL